MRPFKFGCVVEGEDFCPRNELERQLQDYAGCGQNVVVHGARRMGKTSLIKHAIKGMRGEKMIYIDLYCIKTLADFCVRVMKGVAKASEEMSFIKKALALVMRLRPVLAIDPNDGSTTITVDARAAVEPDSLGAVMDMLKKLAADGKTCVVFDEFQDILCLEDHEQILAEMRSSIQFQQNVPYFFSGSIRSAMMEIFDDPDSPFFKSAIPLSVEEINPVEFSDFLISRFKKGRRSITKKTVNEIIEFADGVTGDVQEFCHALYEVTSDGEEVSTEDFKPAFDVIFAAESRGYENIVEKLTMQQLTVLKALAQDGLIKAFSAEFTRKVGMLPSSVKRVIARLTEDKIIYLHNKGYHFFNPFFREWIKSAI